MDSLDVRVVRGKRGFHEIEEDWCRLVDIEPKKELLHTYQWHRSYIETFDDEAESLVFLLLYRSNSLIAIFPFEVVKKDFLGLPFRQLQIPNGDDMRTVDFVGEVSGCGGDLVDFLVDKLKTAVDNGWVRIVFHRISGQSSTYSLLKESRYRLITSEETNACFVLKCTSGEEARKGTSANMKRQLRRARKRLAKLEDVRMLSVSTKTDLRWAFQELLQLESSGWKGRKGTAIKGRERSEKFCRNLTEYFSGMDGCEINLLRVNSRSIAASLTLRVDGTVYCIKMGYDESYSEFSPGMVMMDALIERYGNDSSIDTTNLTSDAEWMARWKPSSMEMFYVCIFRRSLLDYVAYA